MFIRIVDNIVYDVRDASPENFYPYQVCSQYHEFPDGTTVDVGWTYDEETKEFSEPVIDEPPLDDEQVLSIEDKIEQLTRELEEIKRGL